MGNIKTTRSALLYEVEKALERHGITVRIDCVPTLRAVLPNYFRFDKAGLVALAKSLKSCDKEKVRQWQTVPPKPSRRRALLPDDEIVKLRADGIPVPEIARRSGLKRGRIYQILALSEKDHKVLTSSRMHGSSKPQGNCVKSRG